MLSDPEKHSSIWRNISDAIKGRLLVTTLAMLPAVKAVSLTQNSQHYRKLVTNILTSRPILFVSDMQLKRMMSRVWSWFFICLCATGLIWQLTSIIDQYFKFKVSTLINVFSPEIIHPHAMTICLYLSNVVDYERLNKDLNTTYLDMNNMSIRTLLTILLRMILFWKVYSISRMNKVN